MAEHDGLPLERQYQDIDKMTETELREELAQFRVMWSWVPEDLKYWLHKVGSLGRLVTRNYEGYLGRIMQPHFKLTDIEIEVTKDEFNYEEGRHYLESKTVRFPVSQLTHFEFINAQELVEEKRTLEENLEADLPASIDQLEKG
tara:strand:- start:4444 stop:4875 length:432 start_codon:yes stop_codon:yes gene_type:complete